MMTEQIIVTVVGGVLVPIILAVGRLVWMRRRVPTVLTHYVRRKNYLGTVAVESGRKDVTHLHALVPRLTSSKNDAIKRQIQRAWAKINRRGDVRVLTLDSDDCLAGGSELLKDGIEVRVTRRELGSETTSYHIFETEQRDTTVIANHRENDRDQPIRISSSALAQPFRADFNAAWRDARSLEGVVADKILEGLPSNASFGDVISGLQDARGWLGLDPRAVDRVRSHLALRHSAAVVFVLGLPGAGKSLVCARLQDQLKTMRITTRVHTDYMYAYRDYLHGVLKLRPTRGAGFEAADGGAFTVSDERFLVPALQALAQTVRGSMKETGVTLVEFARADLLAALQEFEEIRTRSQVIYVDAPRDLRSQRLIRRAEQPDTCVMDHDIRLRLSNNHALPSGAERLLYSVDNSAQLTTAQPWRDRMFRLENNVDDEGVHVDASLRNFVKRLVERYRPATITGVSYYHRN